MTFHGILYRLGLLASCLRVFFLRATGVAIGSNVSIGPRCEIALGTTVSRRGQIKLGDHNRLDNGVILHPYGGSILLGKHTYVGPHCVIFGHGGVEIGDHTLIAMHCRIVSANHTIPAQGTLIDSLPDIPEPIRIGSDVWLGAGVTVLAGVSIGDGCIVGAGSVVTRDTPPWTILIGSPARVIRERPRHETAGSPPA